MIETNKNRAIESGENGEESKTGILKRKVVGLGRKSAAKKKRTNECRENNVGHKAGTKKCNPENPKTKTGKE